MPTLTVCMIAKNEEHHLERCLASVCGLASEIVVVDTGSTDATVAIAESFGARVYHTEWTDDFSAARNVSLEQATGDWILSLDADESIASRDHGAILQATRRHDIDAVLALQRNYAPPGVMSWTPGDGGYAEGVPYAGYVDVRCRRLFRRRPWLRFRNRVHEELVSLDATRPLRQQRAEWVIHHFGKVADAETLGRKAALYLRIGERKAADRPDDPRAHWELGIQHAERGDAGAARRCFERVIALAPGYRDVALRLALCDAQLGRHVEALQGLRGAAAALPHLAAEAALAEGNLHRQLDDAGAAEAAFRRALDHNPRFVPASVNLALLLERAGRLDEALACVQGALQHAPAYNELNQLRSRLIRALMQALRQATAAAAARLAEAGRRGA